MQTLSEIRQLLDERGLSPKHRLGQNFLHDKNQISKLIQAADLKPGELVLEIGPGTGTLTEALLDGGVELIVCEIDRQLANLIDEKFGDQIKVIRGDCLSKGRALNEEIVQQMGGRKFKLVANLPYQIASTLMSTLLIDHSNCVGQFMTIQNEVADRLTAVSQTKDYGPLSVIVQAFAHVEKLGTISKSCFWPEPDVTSAMVSIIPIPATPEAPEERRNLAQFVTQLFTKRRKQVGTILGRDCTDWPTGISPELRPEALSVDQIISLWRVIHPLR